MQVSQEFHRWKFIAIHPFEVYINGFFHARFTNLGCALATADKLHGSVVNGDLRIDQHEIRKALWNMRPKNTESVVQ